jgi:ribosome-binding protein aMBF1 (putative translation factor)
MRSDSCNLCGSKANLDSIIICPLLNDPVLDVCRQCANNEKIRQNEIKSKYSIWNKEKL